jgi:YVTN family beta-propeller protein
VRRLTALLGSALAGLVAACAASDGAPPAAGSPGGADVPGYRTVANVPLPGGASRWDYQVLDTRAGRLYLAHQGAGEVVSVDVARSRAVAAIPGIASVRGLALAPGAGQLYAAASARDEVAVIDLATAAVVARVPAGRGPDGLAYVASPGRLFVSDEDGGGDTVIDDPASRSSFVALGGSVGDSRYDPWSGLVLVAVGEGADGKVAALDPASGAVALTYPLPGCAGAHGLQVDASGQDRVFVACQDDARLVSVDLATGRVSDPVDVGASPDILALDPGLHRLYVASESGVLTVLDTSGPDPVLLARGDAGADAHSVAVDPNTHLVYLPLADVGGRPVLRVLAPELS